MKYCPDCFAAAKCESSEEVGSHQNSIQSSGRRYPLSSFGFSGGFGFWPGTIEQLSDETESINLVVVLARWEAQPLAAVGGLTEQLR
jgi:hypothetical protein